MVVEMLVVVAIVLVDVAVVVVVVAVHLPATSNALLAHVAVIDPPA